MVGGVWKDERRKPGPWPQGRRAPLAVVVGVVVAILANATIGHSHNRVLIGGLVILISLCGFYTTFRLDPTRLRDERYTRGPGWIVGLAISKLPLGTARLVWLAMSLGLLALGIAEIAGA